MLTKQRKWTKTNRQEEKENRRKNSRKRKVRERENIIYTYIFLKNDWNNIKFSLKQTVDQKVWDAYES